MTVYDHHYKPWKGQGTPRWSRFLVPTRYALIDLFSSKLFLNCFAACFIAPLIFGAIIYFNYNNNVLAFFKLNPQRLMPINPFFYYLFLHWQSLGAYGLTLLVGPLLLSGDYENNALPLYLVRPLTRVEYLLSKVSVLVAVLSTVTWVPGLLLLGLHLYYEDLSWLGENAFLFPAMMGSFGVLIALLSLSSVGFGAWFKTRTGVGLALLATPIIGAMLSYFLIIISRNRFGHTFHVLGMLRTVWREMFQLTRGFFGSDSHWLGLGLICVFFAVLAWRKLRAFEVVS